MANARELLFQLCVVEGVAAGEHLEEENSERPEVRFDDVEVAVAVKNKLGSAVEERVLSQRCQRRICRVDRRVKHVKPDLRAEKFVEAFTS